MNFDEFRRILIYISFLDKYLVPISWPQNGEIIFDNVSLHHKVRTASNGPVLVDINVTIPAGQKVREIFGNYFDHNLLESSPLILRLESAVEREVGSRPSSPPYSVLWM